MSDRPRSLWQRIARRVLTQGLHIYTNMECRRFRDRISSPADSAGIGETFHQWRLRAWLIRLAAAESRGLVTPCRTPAERFHLAMTLHTSLSLFPPKVARLFQIVPGQYEEEIVPFLEAMSVLNPRVIVEIGSASGGNLFLLCHGAAPDARVVSIDLPQGPFGGGYPEWKATFLTSIMGQHQHVDLIRASSHEPETRDRLAGLLAGTPVDLLFIDGDHTYSGVKQDYETYAPFVRNGGWVVFHDIVHHETASGCEVERLWQEVRDLGSCREFVKDYDQRRGGIGVLEVGDTRKEQRS